MRCGRSLLASEGATSRRVGSARERFPTLEAAPAVFAGGARLIPEAEAVLPAELLRAPRAAPGESEAMLHVALEGGDLAGEIGAAGPRSDLHALDAKRGMLVEQLREHALDFHARR